MTTYRIGRRYHYTEYYLIEVEDDEQVENGTVTDLVKMDYFTAYGIDSEKTDGDLTWDELTESEAREIEQRNGITRESVSAILTLNEEEDEEG